MTADEPRKTVEPTAGGNVDLSTIVELLANAEIHTNPTNLSPTSGRVVKDANDGTVYLGDGSSWLDLSSDAGVETPLLQTGEGSIVHEDGTPLIELDTAEGLYGVGDTVRGYDTVLRKHPDNPEPVVRLNLVDDSMENPAFIGRLHKDSEGNIHSHEVLKPVAKDIALEAEIDGGSLRLQESGSTSFNYGAIQLETSDGGGNKTTRMALHGGFDETSLDFENLSSVNFTETSTTDESIFQEFRNTNYNNRGWRLKDGVFQLWDTDADPSTSLASIDANGTMVLTGGLSTGGNISVGTRGSIEEQGNDFGIVATNDNLSLSASGYIRPKDEVHFAATNPAGADLETGKLAIGIDSNGDFKVVHKDSGGTISSNTWALS